MAEPRCYSLFREDVLLLYSTKTCAERAPKQSRNLWIPPSRNHHQIRARAKECQTCRRWRRWWYCPSILFASPFIPPSLGLIQGGSKKLRLFVFNGTWVTTIPVIDALLVGLGHITPLIILKIGSTSKEYSHGNPPETMSCDINTHTIYKFSHFGVSNAAKIPLFQGKLRTLYFEDDVWLTSGCFHPLNENPCSPIPLSTSSGLPPKGD